MKKGTLKNLTIVLPLAMSVAVVLAICCIYGWQHNKVTSLRSQIQQTQASIRSATQQLTAIDNQNNGVVTAVATNSNSVTLLNGQVTLKLPQNWVMATASKYDQRCDIGGLAQWYCLGTTTIIPKALNSNSTTSTYSGITVSVYKNNGSSPLESEGSKTCSGSTPGDTFSSLMIDGQKACYIDTAREQLVYGDQFNNESYTVSNKSYVVVISSNVNNNAGPNGTMKFNDNSQYSPTVKTFAETLNMQGN